MTTRTRHRETDRLWTLYKRHPYCFWCGRRVRKYHVAAGKPYRDNLATLEHLNDRNTYPDGRPLQGLTVLACRRCNNDRGHAAAAGIDWTPPLMATRKIPG